MRQARSGRGPARTGFTLIEILTVVAVIAILVAILFPVFVHAREEARQTTCASNVRQLALGLMLYAQDYDETFGFLWNFGPTLPPEQRFYGVEPTIWTWQNHAMAYIRSYAVHACPSGWSTRSTWSGNSHPANGSYGANDHVIGHGRPNVSGVEWAVTPFALIVAPAATYLILDAGNYTADCSDLQDARYPANYLPGARWNEQCFDNRASGGQRTCRNATRAQAQTFWSSHPDLAPQSEMARDALEGRHHRHITVAFCDGHVKSEDPDRLLFNRDAWFQPAKAKCIAAPPAY